MVYKGVNYLYTSFLSVYHMWISYLDVFICVLSTYDVYEKKDCLVYLSYNTTYTSLLFLLGKVFSFQSFFQPYSRYFLDL